MASAILISSLRSSFSSGSPYDCSADLSCCALMSPRPSLSKNLRASSNSCSVSDRPGRRIAKRPRTPGSSPAVLVEEPQSVLELLLRLQPSLSKNLRASSNSCSISGSLFSPMLPTSRINSSRLRLPVSAATFSHGRILKTGPCSLLWEPCAQGSI